MVGAVSHAARSGLNGADGAIANDSSDMAVLANGSDEAAETALDTSAHAAHPNARAVVHRESIIRTRTGQALEQEIAATRASPLLCVL